VSRVNLTGFCSPVVFYHLLGHIYSGCLVDDDQWSVWGSWIPHKAELLAAASTLDVPSLKVAIAAHDGDQENGKFALPSLGIMFDAEFLADVEFLFGSPASDDRSPVTRTHAHFAHGAILQARSPYFQRLFSSDQFQEGHSASSGSQRAEIPIDEDDCCAEALRRCLTFMYAENASSLEVNLLELASLSGNDGSADTSSQVIVDLWRLARRWEVERLAVVCERVLARSLSVDTVCYFLEESSKSAASPGRPAFFDSCLFFAKYRCERVSRTPGFAEISDELRQKIVSAQPSGVWDDTEADAATKLKKKFQVWKAKRRH
jgi:BTB/POZ domain